jgi:hypothetical protein
MTALAMSIARGGNRHERPAAQPVLEKAKARPALHVLVAPAAACVP